MANTGIKTVLTLQQVKSPCPPPYTGCDCAPGCPTKSNEEDDPNYISPYQSSDCAITYTTDCPELIYTPSDNSVEMEFSLENSVVNNPSVKKIVITLTGTGGPFSHTFTLPNTPSPNYFFYEFTGLTASTSFDLVITYLNSSDTVVKTCPTITFSTDA